jgi:molybdopterin-guanine dinucleotide biosynthesis protein A
MRGHTPSCAILTGGLGSRLGGDKANVDLGGRPMVDWVVAAVEAAGLEPVLVDDRGPDGVVHPIAGILAALDAAGGPVVVVACDVPFVDPMLLHVLASVEEGAAMVRDNPLVARYEPAHRAHLEEALAAQAPLRRTIAALDPFVIEAEVFNVNSPEDLEEARREASRRPIPHARPRSPSSRSGPRS